MARALSVVWLVLNLSCTQETPASLSQDDVSATASAVDPGPRGGPPGAGGPLAGLTADQQGYFNAARARFGEVDSVQGGIAGEAGRGLGPAFNANSCAACHAEPAAGGTSPHPTLGFLKVTNPQIAFATLDRLPGMAQIVPSFITPDGPVREARFVKNADGSNDGGVHDLFTIAGRIDAPDCHLPQPDFVTELKNNNVIFRIPTPVFGLGLVEGTPDSALAASLAATASARKRLGIAGRFNTTGNDGTITRFGWKAQNKSLLLFAGEAYNVEQGVSNEIFANERDTSPGCNLNPTPEDATNLYAPDGTLKGSANDMSSDMVNFAIFARFSAPPTPTTASASELNGQKVFASVGCALCHSATLTGPGGDFHPYSDFAIHHMGPGLADGVSQGGAGGDEFRTAPLWGVGQRIFFLHDGRAGPRNGGLVRAIVAHYGRIDHCVGAACQSEANAVVQSYLQLRSSDQQDLINFLRSL
ncbi:MAG TPA: di-heme oxidoredictase family protein [Myxococcales bacterium]|nr:di-heme oxidoredictase family protein [Myxococcales bacterium]